jgi:hypothetical protein
MFSCLWLLEAAPEAQQTLATAVAVAVEQGVFFITEQKPPKHQTGLHRHWLLGFLIQSRLAQAGPEAPRAAQTQKVQTPHLLVAL